MDNHDHAETSAQSLTELVHRVKSLIPENQKLVTASPEMPVAEALALMRRHNISQLPGCL